MRKLYNMITKTYTRKLVTQLVAGILLFLVAYFSQDINVSDSNAVIRSFLVLLGLAFLAAGFILAVSSVFLVIEYFRHIHTRLARTKQLKAIEASSDYDIRNMKKSGEYTVDYIGPSISSIFLLVISVMIALYATMLLELMGLYLIVDSFGIEDKYILEFVMY